MVEGLKETTAQEIPVQEQSKVTYDMGVMEKVRFFISTDERMYYILMRNPNAVPFITPNNIKEALGIQENLHIFYIIED